MARRRSNAPLSVVLNGREVGTLTRASSGAIGFHYHVDKIVPRHFQQSARQAGFEDRAVREMLEEIHDTAARRITLVKDALPTDIPEHLVASIAAGITRRLNTISLWRQAATE